MAQIKITQIKSTIDRINNQKLVIKALGLGKLNKTVVKNDTPHIRGMINKVRHLIKFEII